MGSLTPAHVQALAAAIAPSTRFSWHVLAKVDTLRLTLGDLCDLRPATWLRDGILNFFMMILRVRGEAGLAAAVARGSDGRGAGLVWTHNSFFYSRLAGQEGGNVYNHANVSSWTAQRGKRLAVDIFAYRYLLIPININNQHWALVVVDNHERTVSYWDSFRNAGKRVVENVLRYMGDEWRNKKGGPPQLYRRIEHPVGLPEQRNVVDCGAFVCCFAECVARGIPPTVFAQEDMVHMRLRIAAMCLSGRLL